MNVCNMQPIYNLPPIERIPGSTMTSHPFRLNFVTVLDELDKLSSCKRESVSEV